MAIDRDATLKQAEKLLRQGKLDGAIAEYVRLVEDQPRDWTSLNTLGDLYVRAGNLDRAVAQFTQVADYLFGEGFLPKAAALYKKTLKVKPDHEHTLLRLSEIATHQGLLADARMYLRQLGRQRRDRGDNRGAAECLVRLATLEEADAEAKIAGARAAQALGDVAQATALFRDAAEEFSKKERSAEALDALAEAARLDPADFRLRGYLARQYAAAGQLDRARAVLTLESAGADPDLLLMLARMEIASGNETEARAVLTRLIAVAPQRRAAILSLAEELAAAAGQQETAFPIVEVLADDAILVANWDAALAALRGFLKHGPYIPALMKLVELAVDAGRDEVMYLAQEQLADAYVAAGRGAEARVIAEDLVARDPKSDAHVERLRRAIALQGGGDAESIITRYREAAAGSGHALDLDLTTVVTDEPAETPAAPADAVEFESAPEAAAVAMTVPPPLPPSPDDEVIVLDVLEIDLSDALAGLSGAAPALPSPSEAPSETPANPPPDLEAVFEEVRNRVMREQQPAEALEHYERALRHLEGGRVTEAIADLKAAARTPVFRFEASSRLGRLYVARGDVQDGIDWLERAAEAPAPSPEEALSVLYDLAGALERIGETARALAVLMEIDADGTAYRDVRQRIDELSRLQAGSPHP